MTARRILFVLIWHARSVRVSNSRCAWTTGDPDPPDNPIPITGIEYLLGGGILYGIRSLLKARKK
ncbi:MAG: hypothetical protein WDO14_14440 [Bacteroidota bacterium]